MTDARISALAQRDLAEAERWIRKDSPRAAANLRREIGPIARQLGSHPKSGFVRPEWPGERTRIVVLHGFPYVVIYDSERTPPLILRVLHGARDLPTVIGDAP